MADNDPVKNMLEDIKIIVEETDVSRQEDALDDLHDYCEDIDLAKGKGALSQLQKFFFRGVGIPLSSS